MDMVKQNEISLAEGYYLENFKTLLREVSRRYSDLLTKEEKLFFRRFMALPENAARLYTRLVSRVGPHFRFSKLSYLEIDLNAAINVLKEKGFVELGGDLEEEELCHLFTRPELNSLLKKEGVKGFSKLTKDEVVALVVENNWSSHLGQEDTIISPQFLEEVEIFRFLFFGNFEQGLSDFILEEIGVLRYEPYKIAKKDRLFSSREDIDHWIDLLNYQVDLWNAGVEKDSEQILICLKALRRKKNLPQTMDLKRRRLLVRGARDLERLELFKEALSFYKLGDVLNARERRIRILAAQEKYRLAEKELREIEQDPRDMAEREFIRIFKPKLFKAMGREIIKNPKELHPMSNLLLQKSEEGVEMAVVNHFQREGVEAHFVENALFTGLFGLLFWDIIFKSRTGVFVHPFQKGPVDLFTHEFREQNEKEIEKRLRQIKAEPDLLAKVTEFFKEKYLTNNYLVQWKKLDEGILKLAIDFIPRDNLLAILEEMAFDLSVRTSGFPDLFVVDTKKGSYKLVEVKGPGDQLQNSQKRWLSFFKKNNIPYEVLRVEWL